jgi:hypothetical protein
VRVDSVIRPAETAIRLHSELGEGATVFVSSRVEEARQACDQAQLQYWHDVAHDLLTHAEESQPDGQHLPLWAWVQRIELYRHRAEELESKAAAGPKACRDERIELAAQWRHLALQAQLLAERQQR